MSTRIIQTVRVTDNLPKLKKSLKALTTKEIVVGWPEDKDKPREGGDGMTNASIAYILDKGSGARNLPAQPALGPGIEEGKEKITQRLRDAGEDALDGDTSAMEKNFIAAGVEGVTAVRNKIVNGPWKKLADSTLAARRRAGFMGTLRYQRSGQLRNAVNFTVRQKNG